jgi:hypothetical protein
MIGSFGGLLFQVSADVVQTFTELKRSAQGRFAQHEVIGAKPLTEYLGPDLDTGSFTMNLDASLGVNPSSMIEKVLSFARNGSASSFILGGRNFGVFNIVSASAAYGIVTGSGGVISAKIDVGLKEYH